MRTVPDPSFRVGPRDSRTAAAGGGGTHAAPLRLVTAAGPVALFARQNPNAITRRRAPGSDFEQWSNVAPPPDKIYSSSDANEAVVAAIVWGLLAIAAIVVTVLVLIARELGVVAGPSPRPRQRARASTASPRCCWPAPRPARPGCERHADQCHRCLLDAPRVGVRRGGLSAG